MSYCEVIVGNIGKVADTDNMVHAEEIARSYEYDSMMGIGRAAGESVYIIQDGDLVYDFVGRIDRDGDDS